MVHADSSTQDAVGSLNVTSILPEGYTAIPFSMDVSLEPGGEVMTFNGTVTVCYDHDNALI